MKSCVYKLLLLPLISILFSCKKSPNNEPVNQKESQNSIEYASGLQIEKHNGYSIVRISNPWPAANKKFTYILKEKMGVVPDSLAKHPVILVPLQTVVVTSTTIIPFLEMLGVEKKLIAFPHTDYVSSIKTRKLIDAGSVKNIGQNESLNTEQLIDLSPSLIVAFGIDNSNPTLDNLEKSGLKVLLQADWMEQTPLGKAEWIKLYGALFDKEKEAKKQFDAIVKNYTKTQKLVENKKPSMSVLYGAMFQDQWYVAKGNSWVAQFMKDSKVNYLWANEPGTGSLAIPFEKVLLKGQKASFWIATGAFKTIQEFTASNPHYQEFEATKTKNIYTFENKLGATGGAIYYELAASRPDLVLQDYIKIFYPELLPNYTFTFAQKLN